MSNITKFKYQWIWAKSRKTGFANANRQPLRNYEDILVFYNHQCIYNPQGLITLEAPKEITRKKPANDTVTAGENDGSLCKTYIKKYTNYPSQILSFSSEGNTVHPTQKPVALFEYLIKTYTNCGDTVLDNCIGSGTTAVACINTKRNFIGIEKEEKYYNIAKERINSIESKNNRT